MAHRMSDTYDIFISYAHVDNQPFIGIKHGWVSNLFRTLTTALERERGAVRITSSWQDVQSEEHTLVASDVQKRLEQSALFLVVLSPSYLASEQCQQELAAFLEIIKVQADWGKPRLFIVETSELETSELPSTLADQPIFSFWMRDERARVRTLAVPQPHPDDNIYYQKVDDLARMLSNSLKAVPPETERSAKQVTVDSPLRSVYLAKVSEDLRREYDGMRRYLEQYNFQILPEPHASLTLLERNPQLIEGALKKSDLFLQLLSDQPIQGLDDPQLNLVQRQYELARAQNIPVWQWQSPDLDERTMTESAQQALLKQGTVHKMDLEEFKQMVRRHLTKPREIAAPPGSFVFLNADQEDQRLAGKIGRILGQLGVDYKIRRHEGKPSQIRKDLRVNLTNCEAAIVVYGEIHAKWVNQQFTICQKIDRSWSSWALALYEGPPEEKEEVELPLSEIQVLNCRRGIDEVQLRNFLSPLLSGRSL